MISAVILTKNEEQNIERCLESVKWCDEIVIIDDKSSDRTVQIAKRYNATIYPRVLSNDFSAQRNFGISKVKHEWILFIDSDEIISDALAYEILNAVGLKDQNLRGFNGFYLKRSDFIWGKQLKHGESGNVQLLRLGRKGFGKWKGTVHERWIIKKPIGKLINPILHYPHRTLEEFLREINFYTDIKAEELKNKNATVSFFSILFYPLGKFAVNYIFRTGFMDGIQGIIFAITMSFHSFLVRSKLWVRKNA
jgi:glycosyltransferase involved in cell wall biosynthesis